mmetsp:Transcript_79917/g.258890  ORF Transcript_79917/g.258890 Transcript_79917/m.258890 type:complete len:267 (+) Transcript_79917:395-1195(+)
MLHQARLVLHAGQPAEPGHQQPHPEPQGLALRQGPGRGLPHAGGPQPQGQHLPAALVRLRGVPGLQVEEDHRHGLRARALQRAAAPRRRGLRGGPGPGPALLRAGPAEVRGPAAVGGARHPCAVPGRLPQAETPASPQCGRGLRHLLLLRLPRRALACVERQVHGHRAGLLLRRGGRPRALGGGQPRGCGAARGLHGDHRRRPVLGAERRAAHPRGDRRPGSGCEQSRAGAPGRRHVDALALRGRPAAHQRHGRGARAGLLRPLPL